ENLLDFLRAEDELKIAKKSFINIAEVIREAANSKALRSTLEKKGLKLVVDIREGISDTAGNKIRATQFFLNLIEVLSSYLERDDVIRVSVYESEAMRVALTFPRRMPEAVTSLLQNSAPKSLFHAEQSEEKLKMHLAGKVAEVHRWNISTGNVNNSFVVSLAIPRNARQRIETVTDAAMGMFLELIAALLGLDTSSIMLIDEFTGELTIKSARGLDEDIVRRARVTVGEGIAGWVALEGKPLLIGDIEGDPGFGRRNAPGYNTKSLLSLPIKIGDKVAGVLNLNNKRTTETFSARDLHIGVALSERISYFMERLYSGKYREDDYKRFMASFDGLLYAVRKYHKKEAAFPILGEKIMDRLGKKEEETRLALYTLLLYDLGLMLLDESLLRKKGLLPSEVRTLKIHPYGTIDLIRDFEFSERVKEAILHHHERYDGTGYPDALSGNDIPLISRIICVVDAFCAMIEERPYRRARAKDEALLELRKGAGTIYDPEIVKALEDIYKTSLPDGL
ncbi:MAG TPA: HD domain-containing phosphohydrolase, partial [Dissulfurispiraceae bacterium]